MQKTRKCVNCKEKFIQKGKFQKHCSKIECINSMYAEFKENQIKKAVKQKSIKTVELMSADEYRSKKIQPLINELARIIDDGCPCVATGNFGRLNGGHLHSVGSNRTIAINLHNIHVQSFQSNTHKGGDYRNYIKGIESIYGKKYAEFIDTFLLSCPALHLTKMDLEELRPRLLKIRNRLKKENKQYSPEERIELRNVINKELAIYPEKYSNFI